MRALLELNVKKFRQIFLGAQNYKVNEKAAFHEIWFSILLLLLIDNK